MDVFRAATSSEAAALTDLERVANLVALAHVFPDTPYPQDEVRARWERTVERATGVTHLLCLVANHRARGVYAHLGCHPPGREQTAVWPPYPREMEYAR